MRWEAGSWRSIGDCWSLSDFLKVLRWMLLVNRLFSIRFSAMSFDNDDVDDYVGSSGSGLDAPLFLTFVGVATLHECSSNAFVRRQ